jgi:predicted ATP-grasp superfamily ATP-dependent carboligase
MENFGTYAGLLAGFGGFFTAIAAVLYTRGQVGQVKAATKDLDWQEVAELSIDVAKLKKAAQKWQNNVNAQEKVSQKELFEQAMTQRLLQNQQPQHAIKMVEM